MTTPSTPTSSPARGYLHLRAARGAFLLESVDQGRLGRYSLVGCGDRLVSSRRPRASTRRSSATSATTTSRSSSRRCRCRPRGRAAGEPVRRRRHARALRPRAEHGRGARGDPSDRLARRGPRAAGDRRRRGTTQRFPDAEDVQRGVERARSTSVAATRSRSCSRSAPSGGPTSRQSRSTARFAASTRRRTSSCSSSTASRSSARRRRRS